MNDVVWLASITRDVHRPLLASVVLRIIQLLLDIATFSSAGWAVVSGVRGKSVIIPLLVLSALALSRACARYLEQFTGHYVAFKALEVLRGQAFTKLWPKSPGIVAHAHSGELLAALTKDVDRIEVVYAHTVAPAISAIIVPAIALVTAGFIAGWGVVAIPAFCVLIALISIPLFTYRRGDALNDRRKLTAHVTDSVFGAREIIRYGRQTERVTETTALGRRLAKPQVTAGIRRGIVLILGLLSTCAVLGVGTRLHPSPELLVVLAAGSVRLFEAPRELNDAAGYLDQSLSAIRRLRSLFDAPTPVQSGTAELVVSGAPTIEFHTVNCTSPTLSDISFIIPAGKRTLIVGPSGVGKTTIVQLLLRYRDPTSGTITIDGQDIRNFTLDSLHRTIVLVPQRADVLDTTIAENLRLGAPDASDTDLWRVLEIAQLAEEIRTMPLGLSTPVGVAGRALSGGQLQRLCLARALLLSPKVLVLDEFTAALNTELDTAVRKSLAATFPDLTIIEITHRQTTHRDTADYLIALEDGKVNYTELL